MNMTIGDTFREKESAERERERECKEIYWGEIESRILILYEKGRLREGEGDRERERERERSNV